MIRSSLSRWAVAKPHTVVETLKHILKFKNTVGLTAGFLYMIIEKNVDNIVCWIKLIRLEEIVIENFNLIDFSILCWCRK